MTDTPSPIAIAEAELARLLAACPAFQAWTGCATAAQAAGRVYLEGLPEPHDAAVGYTIAEWAALRPFAIVALDRNQGLALEKNSIDSFADCGRLILILEQSVPTAAPRGPAEQDRLWHGTLGRIAAEMMTLSGTSDYLYLSKIVLEQAHRADAKEIPTDGDFQAAIFAVQWGYTR